MGVAYSDGLPGDMIESLPSISPRDSMGGASSSISTWAALPFGGSREKTPFGDLDGVL